MASEKDPNIASPPEASSAEGSTVSLKVKPSNHDESHEPKTVDTPPPMFASAPIFRNLLNEIMVGIKNYWKFVFSSAAPIILLASFWPLIYHEDIVMQKLGGGGFTMALMIVLWLTEALPLPVTSLIPVFTGPMFGILSSDDVVCEYFNDTILLLLGGMALAQCFEFSNLHQRFALRIILLSGSSPEMLLLGIMLTTACLSLFMNNTSVTALMAPIIIALMECIEAGMKCILVQEFGESEPNLETAEIESSIFLSDSAAAPAGGRRPTFNTLQHLPLTPTAILSMHSHPPPDPQMTHHESIATILTDGNVSSVLPDSKPDKIQMEKSMEVFMKNTKKMLLLALCYTANISGTGMITGSGTNTILINQAITYKDGLKEDARNIPFESPSFLVWTAFAIMPMLVNLIFLYFFLMLFFLYGKKIFRRIFRQLLKRRPTVDFKVTEEVQRTIKVSLRESYNSLGKISLHEIEVIGIFITVLILWIGSDKNLFPRVGNFFKPTSPSLATSAVFGILLMFTIPRNPEFCRHIARGDFHMAKYETVMEWEYFHRNFPWGIIMLLGGGFAMSAVTKAAGLNEVLEDALKGLQGVNKDVVLIVVIYLATFFTEVASNTAIANIILPILFISSGPHIFNVHPMFLTFPATIACSHAFMFPVSTPPNSIAFSAGKMKVLDMLIPGVFLNFSTGVVLYVSTKTWGKVVYGEHF